MGPTFMARAQEETSCGPAEIARAYTAAREIFDMRKLWVEIEALDNRVPARLQYEMMYQASRLLRHVTYWLLAHFRGGLQVDKAVAQFRRGVQELEQHIGKVLVGTEAQRFEKARKSHIKAGVPIELATRIANLEAHNAALDIIELARQSKAGVAAVARIYFEVGTHIGLDWLRDQVERLHVDGPWQALARRGLRDNALRVHRCVTERVLAGRERGSAEARVAAWAESAGDSLAHWKRTLHDMRTAGAGDFATLSVGFEAVRKLAD